MARRPRRFGRYLLFESFARGGMATVCFGRVSGAVGFSRVVAIKRCHPHLAKDPDFVSMLVDEGRLAGRIRHPSVVPVIDVVQLPGELLLVMDYVDGVSLAKLWRVATDRKEHVPLRVAVAIIGAVLQGLHAAHEMRDERGELSGVVHRDVSPQNVIVGRDGLARVTDFGIALARERMQFTRTEEIKGKLEYMAREQLRRERVDRRTDVYAASVVLWELLTGARPFAGDTDRTVLGRIATSEIKRPSSVVSDIPPELDELVARGLSPAPSERFATAFEMALELDRVVAPATPLEVARWVEENAGKELAERAARVAEIEAWRDEPAVSPAEETLTHPALPAEDGPAAVEVEPEPSALEALPTAPAEDVAAQSGLEAVPPPGPSTETRVNAVRNVTPASSSREKWVWALPLLAFVLGALLLAVVVVRRLASSTVAVPSAPAALPTVVAPTQPAPVGTAAPDAPAAPAPARSSAPTLASAAPPPTPIKPRAPRPSSQPSCDPPFTVDAKGVRVPKRECFPR